METGRGTRDGELLRRLVRRDVDTWDGHVVGPPVLELARRHRVAGRAARRLVELDVPTDRTTLDGFALERRRAETHHLVALRATDELASSLSVPFVVVKGPVLASHWYRQAGDRTYGDVDVVVDPADFPTAVTEVEALGYTARATNWAGFHRHGVAEAPFGRDGLTLDLHWDLVGLGSHRRDLALDTTGALRRARVVRVGGPALPTLDAEDTLIHLCVHGGLSGGRRLVHVLDVDTVMRAATLDWDEVVHRARRARAAALVAGMLERASRLLGSPVPPGLVDRLAPFTGWPVVVRTLDRWSPPGAVTGPGVHLEGARDAPVAAASATVERTVQAVRMARGGSAPTEPGGGLAWRDHADDGGAAVAADRAVYMRWVGDGGLSYRVRACRDPDHLMRLFEHLEPRSSMALGWMWTRDRLDGAVRAFVVRREDGECAGMVVHYRRTPLQALAAPILLDPGAAPVVAGLIDGSGAWALAGFDADVLPLRPHMTRWRRSTSLKSGAAPPGSFDPEPVPDVVPAGPADVDALAGLFATTARGPMPRAFARTWARRAVRTGAVLLNGDAGEPVGFLNIEASTRTYDTLGTIGLLPEYRGRGLSWGLVVGAATLSRANGRGIAAMSLEDNPMSIPGDRVIAEPGTFVLLRPPRRFRGEPRLWRWLQQLSSR